MVGTDTPADRIIADMHVLPHCRFGVDFISVQLRDRARGRVPSAAGTLDSGWGLRFAAAWARHAHHRRAKVWIDQDEGPLAFCRITQMSLLRPNNEGRGRPPSGPGACHR